MVKAGPKILVIKSDKKELKKVDVFLSEIFNECNLDRANYNKTLLCVSEAVINSIEHGNQNDTTKFVTIKVYCYLNEIQIAIIDEGAGFNLKKIEDPTNKENVTRESGRGIHIIKTLSNSLEYNKKGNCVQLKIECK